MGLNERMQMSIFIDVSCVALEPIEFCYCCVARMWRAAVLTQSSIRNAVLLSILNSTTVAPCTLFRDPHKRIIDKLCHDSDSTHWKRKPMPKLRRSRRPLLFTSSFIELKGKRNMILFTPFLFSLNYNPLQLRRVGSSNPSIRSPL